jgi:hypothetical protein
MLALNTEREDRGCEGYFESRVVWFSGIRSPEYVNCNQPFSQFHWQHYESILRRRTLAQEGMGSGGQKNLIVIVGEVIIFSKHYPYVMLRNK